MKRLSALAVASLLMAGCLIKKTTHTLYLEADGAVTWSVLEADVRSDEEKPENRWEEEVEYLDSASNGEHPALRFFDHLGARELESRFLRSRRPYTLLMEARFDSIESLLHSGLVETGMPAVIDFDSWDGWSRLSLTLDVAAMEDMDLGDTPVAEAFLELLLDSSGDFQILLAEGWFVDALNFTIDEEDTRAVPDELSDEQIEAAGRFLTYCLAWSEHTKGGDDAISPLRPCVDSSTL